MKTTPKALSLLRLITALSGEKQYEAMERLFSAEAQRLQKKQQSHSRKETKR